MIMMFVNEKAQTSTP